jgi:hypothetical protein
VQAGDAAQRVVSSFPLEGVFPLIIVDTPGLGSPPRLGCHGRRLRAGGTLPPSAGAVRSRLRTCGAQVPAGLRPAHRPPLRSGSRGGMGADLVRRQGGRAERDQHTWHLAARPTLPRPRRTSAAWTCTRSAVTSAGTGTSLWRCSLMPTSRSRRPTRRQRGVQKRFRPPGSAHHGRNPPAPGALPRREPPSRPVASRTHAELVTSARRR